MRTCQLQDAKAHFSEVVNTIEKEGPMIVTVHGRKKVVIISIKDYEQKIKPRETLLEFFRRSPLRGVDLKIERDKSPMRDVKL